MSNKPEEPERPVDYACSGLYSQIDFEKLTENDVTEFDNLGYTFLHHAARHGVWKRIPAQLRENKKLWKESKDGDSVYISAYYSADQSWIIKNELSEEDILKRNHIGNFIAHMATRNRTLYTYPKSLLTPKVLLQEVDNIEISTLSVKSTTKDKLIHQIARHNQLNTIPREIFSEELLSTRGVGEETPYHIIAGNEQAKAIPKELWTKKALSLTTETGVSPLHSIVLHTPDIIPRDIDLKSLLQKNSTGETPLHVWARNHKVMDIPDNFITKETLSLEGKYDHSLLEIIVIQYLNEHTFALPKTKSAWKRNISKILGKASEKTLESLKINVSPPTLAQNELFKRKLMKKISQSEKSISIQ